MSVSGTQAHVFYNYSFIKSFKYGFSKAPQTFADPAAVLHLA